MNSFRELCQKRRSIRTFSSQPVEREKIDYILQCALMSPSGKRLNPWEFVVVTGEPVLRQLAGCKTYGSQMFNTAMAGIVVALDSLQHLISLGLLVLQISLTDGIYRIIVQTWLWCWKRKHHILHLVINRLKKS